MLTTENKVRRMDPNNILRLVGSQYIHGVGCVSGGLSVIQSFRCSTTIPQLKSNNSDDAYDFIC